MGIVEYFRTLQLGLIFFQTLVLLFTLFLLKKFAWKGILSFIQEEEAQHTEALEGLEKIKQKTARLEAASEKIMNQAQKRSQSIIDSALAHQKALLEEGRQMVAQEKEEMVQKAMAHLAEEQATERANFKKEAATLVISVTEKLLRTTIDNQYKDKLLLAQLVEDATQETNNNV